MTDLPEDVTNALATLRAALRPLFHSHDPDAQDAYEKLSEFESALRRASGR
jgi:hypothetical protein